MWIILPLGETLYICQIGQVVIVFFKCSVSSVIFPCVFFSYWLLKTYAKVFHYEHGFNFFFI